MAGDSWLSDYDFCSNMGQDIMEKINERDKHARTSSAYTKLSAQIRTKSKQFNSDLNRLKQNLMRASASYHITQREVERRQRMMDALITKEKQIDSALKNEGQSRTMLLAGATGSGAETFSSNDPWGMGDDPDISNADLHQQQHHIIMEQDRGLDALSSVIGRQKQMAIDIGNEVDDQNELLDDFNERVDRTDNRIQRETRHIKIVDRKSNACCYYVIIVLFHDLIYQKYEL
ncbi:hypothetical protein RRG08_049287 [Elysia crispata]|uniref:Syntaxin-8 n=1 Tax=Elysia crispata TaxID=231223 RepID=A0AAE1B1E0_9GAST|nr:hypothetical protein RRG08_049287 [Elysia crispata]